VTTNDPVGVALAGIGAGSATGAAVMTAGVLTLRLLQAGGTTSAEIGGSLLTATLFGGIVAAVLSGWVATASIDDTWRRGVSAAVAVLGAALLAIGATVADQFLNVAGLGVYCVALIVAAVLTHRLAYRLGHA
jgi:hypothetical protein